MGTPRGHDSSTAGAGRRPLPLPPEAFGARQTLAARARAFLCRAAVVLLLAACLGFTSDGLRLNAAERAASPHLHSLVRWEARNFMDKWVHRAASVLPWNWVSASERAEMVGDYFALSAARSEIAGRIDAVGARDGAGQELAGLEAQLAALDRSRLRIRAEVEEALESAISAVLAAEGLGSFGGIILPPVDVRLTGTPHVLVTSPRDRIERGDEALLSPRITLSQSVEVERELMDRWNLSALVLPIGGLASYPAAVYGDADLRWTLQTAAHEWLHHRMFFRPLGFGMFTSAEMRTLNETMANVAGGEIGDLAFAMLGGEVSAPVHRALPAPSALNPHGSGAPDGFDFRAEMRATRLHADELLAEGRTETAEAYMEMRRLVFVENGYDIRRLNQAYFAFHGTYADSAASSSPIGDQVQEYRNLSPDLGTFISRMSSLGSYDGFLRDLAALRSGGR